MTAILVDRALRIPLRDHTVVDGDVVIPEQAGGLVVFAHGSGSSRHSPRNRAVASGLWGLDVYSLWESLRRVIDYLEDRHPEALEAAVQAFDCFEPYREDLQEYARATRMVPMSATRAPPTWRPPGC